MLFDRLSLVEVPSLDGGHRVREGLPRYRAHTHRHLYLYNRNTLAPTTHHSFRFLFNQHYPSRPLSKAINKCLNCIGKRRAKTHKNQAEKRASRLYVGLPLGVLLLNERILAFSLHLPLLHEEVVLNPEGQSVHHHWHYYNNNNELQDGVVLNPAHDEEGELLEGVLEPVLEPEEHSLSNTDNRHPDQELYQPGLIVYPKCLWEYWYLSID